MLPRTTYLVDCVPILVLELCFKTLYVWKREIESENRKQNQCYLTRHTKDYTTLLERFSHRYTRWTRASQSAPSTKSKPPDLHHSASPKALTHKQQGDIHTVGHMPRHGETPLPIGMPSRPGKQKRMCSHLPARVNCGPLKITALTLSTPPRETPTSGTRCTS